MGIIQRAIEMHDVVVGVDASPKGVTNSKRVQISCGRESQKVATDEASSTSEGLETT